MDLVKQPDTPERNYKGYTLTAFDPYGFWRITSYENGKIPDKLNSNTFTGVDQAKMAIDSFHNELELLAAQKPAPTPIKKQ